MDADKPKHPINYVARRSGLTTHAIRVWERRYGAVTPVRTGKNRRLYSDADIERLRLLKIITAAGHSIGQIATLPEAELRALAAASEPEGASLATAPPSPIADGESPDDILRRCKQATLAMDAPALERALKDATFVLPQLRVLEEVVAPLMRWVGEEWHAARIRVGHEHLASAVVRKFLVQARSAYPDLGPGPSIVISTPSGQHHEIGAQLAACTAAMEGWRDVYLGPNLPLADIASAARDTKARAVALSLTYVAEARDLIEEARDLLQSLPPKVTLILGGAAAVHHKELLESAGAKCVSSLTEFRDELNALSSARS